jgi:hypothetical protein
MESADPSLLKKSPNPVHLHLTRLPEGDGNRTFAHHSVMNWRPRELSAQKEAQW